MAVVDPIHVEGLRELQRGLRQLDAGLPKALRLANNEAAQLVVAWARPRVPSRTGRAAKSVRATSSQREARVTGGGARTPYYPWLDFGGRVGPRRSVVREFIKEGRYIYPGYTTQRDEVQERLVDALVAVARQGGLEIQP